MTAASLAIEAPDHARTAAAGEATRVRVAVGATLVLGFAIVALIYLPVVLLVLLAFSDDPLSGFPGGFTLRWFTELFENPEWVEPLRVTVEIGVIVAVLCMAAATLLGRALPRMGRRAQILLIVFLLPLVVPGIVLGVEVFTFYRTVLGIRPGLWSIILVHFAWGLPFALLGMLVVTLRFDLRLVDAAADLGASPWRQFWDIERPLIMPGIVTAGLFGFMLSITELPRTLFVRGGEITLPVYVWAQASARTSQIPVIYCLNAVVAAVSVVLSILVVVLLSRAARGAEERAA